MTWQPDQYERFKEERRQPFLDLLALIEHRPKMHVVDFGCGTGELTRELHDHLNAEETMGIDNSETMLLKSGTFANQVLRFSQGDIEAFVQDLHLGGVMLFDRRGPPLSARTIAPPRIPSRSDGILRSAVVAAQNDGVTSWR